MLAKSSFNMMLNDFDIIRIYPLKWYAELCITACYVSGARLVIGSLQGTIALDEKHDFNQCGLYQMESVDHKKRKIDEFSANKILIIKPLLRNRVS